MAVNRHQLVDFDAADLARLMAWFPDAQSAELWSGPSLRYPFDSRTFGEDLRLDQVATYALKLGDELIGFGQIYERYGRIHLARLAVSPDRRGKGWGRILVDELLRAGRKAFDSDEYGLFVYGDNVPAVACYRAMGFDDSRCPEADALGSRAIYMTRPVDAE